MRIKISHETRYHYDAPAAGVIQTLRLTPRNHEGQYVVHWRIDVSEDSRLDVHEDAFGNITHTFSADGPFDDLRAYHRALHERVLREFVGIGEDELEAPSTYWETEPMSLRFRLHRPC